MDIVLNHVKQTLLSTLAQELKEEETSWGFIKHCLRQLLQDGTRLLSEISEKEAVVRSEYFTTQTQRQHIDSTFQSPALHRGSPGRQRLKLLLRTMRKQKGKLPSSLTKFRVLCVL